MMRSVLAGGPAQRSLRVLVFPVSRQPGALQRMAIVSPAPVFCRGTTEPLSPSNSGKLGTAKTECSQHGSGCFQPGLWEIGVGEGVQPDLEKSELKLGISL